MDICANAPHACLTAPSRWRRNDNACAAFADGSADKNGGNGRSGARASDVSEKWNVYLDRISGALLRTTNAPRAARLAPAYGASSGGGMGENWVRGRTSRNRHQAMTRVWFVRVHIRRTRAQTRFPTPFRVLHLHSHRFLLCRRLANRDVSGRAAAVQRSLRISLPGVCLDGDYPRVFATPRACPSAGRYQRLAALLARMFFVLRRLCCTHGRITARRRSACGMRGLDINDDAAISTKRRRSQQSGGGEIGSNIRRAASREKYRARRKKRRMRNGGAAASVKPIALTCAKSQQCLFRSIIKPTMERIARASRPGIARKRHSAQKRTCGWTRRMLDMLPTLSLPFYYL